MLHLKISVQNFGFFRPVAKNRLVLPLEDKIWMQQKISQKFEFLFSKAPKRTRKKISADSGCAASGAHTFGQSASKSNRKNEP